MTCEEFLKKIQDVLQRPQALRMEDRLEELEEWDSLSMMATAVFFKHNFQVEIAPEKFDTLIQVKDLWELRQEKGAAEGLE